MEQWWVVQTAIYQTIAQVSAMLTTEAVTLQVLPAHTSNEEQA